MINESNTSKNYLEVKADEHNSRAKTEIYTDILQGQQRIHILPKLHMLPFLYTYEPTNRISHGEG